jgi:hypothetical protein
MSTTSAGPPRLVNLNSAKPTIVQANFYCTPMANDIWPVLAMQAERAGLTLFNGAAATIYACGEHPVFRNRVS